MERDEAPACGAAPVHRPGVDGTRDLQPQRAQERSRHEAEDKAFGRAVPQQARRRPDVFVLRPYGVTLNVGRGYDGWSSIRAAAERLDDDDVILYFGDFDPSGEDMVRSLRERLADQDSEPTIIKCALVFEDIERYGLPPDFAKATDTRAAAFVARYGPRSSVELDALPVDVLTERLRTAVEEHLDLDALTTSRALEELDQRRLVALLEAAS